MSDVGKTDTSSEIGSGFWRGLGKFASYKTAIFADLIGAFGLFGMIYGILAYFSSPAGVLWGMPVPWLSLALFVSCGLLLMTIIVLAFARHVTIKGDASDRALRELQSGKSLTDRFAQCRAFTEMQTVYGYHIQSYEIQYRIWGNSTGHKLDADGTTTITFVCGATNVGKWARSAESGLAAQSGSITRHLSGNSKPFNVEAEPQSKSAPSYMHSRLVEFFTFQPTITRHDGAVRLSFTTESKGTFALQEQVGPAKGYDWTSFAPKEPVETLKLSVEFVDCKPRLLEPFAVYTPGKFPLGVEEMYVHRSFRSDQTGRGMTAVLEVKYPVMGVTYGIRWPLEPVANPGSEPVAGALEPEIKA